MTGTSKYDQPSTKMYVCLENGLQKKMCTQCSSPTMSTSTDPPNSIGAQAQPPKWKTNVDSSSSRVHSRQAQVNCTASRRLCLQKKKRQLPQAAPSASSERQATGPRSGRASAKKGPSVKRCQVLFGTATHQMLMHT